MFGNTNTCFLCYLVLILAIVGALNWGLVGAFDFNLVDYLFGAGSVISRIVYALVGLSGLALISKFFMDCPVCNKGPFDKY